MKPRRVVVEPRRNPCSHRGGPGHTVARASAVGARVQIHHEHFLLNLQQNQCASGSPTSWAGSLWEQPHLVIIGTLPVVPSTYFLIWPPNYSGVSAKWLLRTISPVIYMTTSSHQFIGSALTELACSYASGQHSRLVICGVCSYLGVHKSTTSQNLARETGGERYVKEKPKAACMNSFILWKTKTSPVAIFNSNQSPIHNRWSWLLKGSRLRSGSDMCKLCNANVLARAVFNFVSWRSAWETCLSLAVSLNHMDIISSIYVFLLFAVVATGHLEAGRLNAHVPPQSAAGATPLRLSEQIPKCWWFSSSVLAQRKTPCDKPRVPTACFFFRLVKLYRLLLSIGTL